MSEHTKGRLKARNNELLQENGRFRMAPTITACGAGGNLQKGVDAALSNARRLAAAWNACEGMTTENLESIVFVGETIRIRFDFISAELRQAQAELNAARALLREVVDMVSSEEYNDTIRKADAYLDAFDTLEGKC